MNVLLGLSLWRVVKIADCLIDQEQSSKGTILVLQVFLVTYY